MSEGVPNSEEHGPVWPPPPQVPDTSPEGVPLCPDDGFPAGCEVEVRPDGSLRVAEGLVTRQERKQGHLVLAALVNVPLLVVVLVRVLEWWQTHHPMQFGTSFLVWGAVGALLLGAVLVPTAWYSWTEWFADTGSLEWRQWIGPRLWRVRRYTDGSWQVIYQEGSEGAKGHWELRFRFSESRLGWRSVWIGDHTEESRNQLHNLGARLAAHTGWPLSLLQRS